MEENNSIECTESAEDTFVKLFSYRDRPLSDDIMTDIFLNSKKTRINPMPFLKLDDLNNQNEQDDIDDNKPKRAIVAGIKWEF